MKKEYMKPAMGVVEIEYRYGLLQGSNETLDKYEGKKMQMFGGTPENQISDEDDIM